MRLHFVVPGPPVNYQRVGGGSDGRRFTPHRSRAYRRHVASCAGAALLSLPRAWPRDVRYAMTLRVAYADRRARDLDNAAKMVCDALNAVAYDDDSQIDRLIVERLNDPKSPRIEVTIEVER